MEESPELKTSRKMSASSHKDNQIFTPGSRSVAISQSQTKALERYILQKETRNGKISEIHIRRNKTYNKGKAGNSYLHCREMTKSNLEEKNEYAREREVESKLSTFNEVLSFKNEENYISYVSEIQMDTIKNESYRLTMRKTNEWIKIQKSNTRTSSAYKTTEAKEKKASTKPESKIKLLKEKSSQNMELSLIRRKSDNAKEIEQKLRVTMSRGGFKGDNQKLMSIREFSRKCGYPENSKIFIWNSEDDYLRRILLSWGWIQNNSLESPFFHLKWTYMPNFADIKVNDKQFVNHFKNSHEISSKSYLTKNLKNNQCCYGNIDKYYPKCFDVGNESEWIEFLEEYRHNIMLILLKKVYVYFYTKEAEKMNELDKLNKFWLSHPKRHISPLRSKGFRGIEMEDYKNRNQNFVIQVQLVIEVVRYWRNFRKERSVEEDNSFHFLEFRKNSFLSHFEMLEKYSTFEDISSPFDAEVFFTKEHFSTPSEILMTRISKEYQFCIISNALFPSYGESNIWIVKPTSTSRGKGIYLTSRTSEILNSAKGIQSRLVQKYIEKPLIIKNEKWSTLHMRKFDLRQWVLLKSIEPFEVYMFEECYLRLCHDRYEVSQISELNRHLTNYSINKEKFKLKDESILELKVLKAVLAEEYGISWDLEIKPKIIDIILKSMKSCLENMECSGNSFELLGYDILIDENFNPWLLEINMSPACEERTPWLSESLNEMGEGLLRIVLPETLLPTECLEKQSKWELLWCEQSEPNSKKKNTVFDCEIVGVNVNLESEYLVDKMIVENEMAFKIQRFFKKYLPRLVFKKSEKNRMQLVLSRYIYGFKTFLCKRRIQNIQSPQIIKTYLETVLQFRGYLSKVKAKHIKLIDCYLKVVVRSKYFGKDLEEKRKKDLMVCVSSIQIRNEFVKFFREIENSQTKISLIQNKIKTFLHFRTQKKQVFEKYFHTLVITKAYKEKLHNYHKKQQCELIEAAFHTTKVSSKYRKILCESMLKIASQYLKALPSRKEFYAKKIDIFRSSVGRVIKVAHRRARCFYMNEIIFKWRLQKKLGNSEVVYDYFKGFIAFNRFEKAKRRKSHALAALKNMKK